MDDQLDEELKNRIKKVFDEYEDPSADKGWAELRTKFPVKETRRRVILWPWLGAAALALLALGFGIWKLDTNKPQTVIAVVKPAGKNQPGSLHAASHQAASQAGERVNPAGQPGVAKTPAHQPAAGVKANPSPVYASAKPVSRGNKLAAGAQTISNNIAVNVNPPAANQVKSNDNALSKPDSGKIAQNVQPAGHQPAINQQVTSGTTPAQGQTPAKPKNINEMLAQNNPPVPKKVDIKPDRVRLGVYAASYVNYAKGSANQANAGAGFSAEIRLAKNLKLVTGVTLAGNSLNYTGGIPAGAAQTELFTEPGGVLGGANAAYPSAYKANADITVASVPAFKNYGASLLSLDVPLNLKYDFNIKNNNFYLMTGLSSGTFASESYTYYYNYPALPSPSLQQDHAETSKSYFSNFYWGKMLNVAVGYGYPIGGNHLIIEPFVKYPLGGLGAQNIRFGAGGINLKINFPTK